MNKIYEVIDSLRSKVTGKDIYEIAKIGTLPNDSTIEIFVRSNDGGNVPHFHVWKRKKSNTHEWETCLKFESAEYFKHKVNHVDIKTSVAKEIDKFLRSPDPESGGTFTYWQTAVMEWNRNNSSRKLDRSITQPDYSKLNN